MNLNKTTKTTQMEKPQDACKTFIVHLRKRKTRLKFTISNVSLINKMQKMKKHLKKKFPQQKCTVYPTITKEQIRESIKSVAVITKMIMWTGLGEVRKWAHLDLRLKWLESSRHSKSLYLLNHRRQQASSEKPTNVARKANL